VKNKLFIDSHDFVPLRNTAVQSVLPVSDVLHADWCADCECYMEIVRIGKEGHPSDLHSAVQ
jgi:ribosomal protein S26